MPDVAVHTAFGRQVRDALKPEVQGSVREQPWSFGLYGPDLWFLYKPWRRREGRGRQMHTTQTGAFLCALLEQARISPCREELFSWLAGFCCHYALDSVTHPYIIHLTTREHVFIRSHMSLEHELDMRQMERDGALDTKHPVTEHYFRPVRLPPVMRADVDAVFQKVYGWTNSWKALNRSARRYRLCYRLLENPSGLVARLARGTGLPLFHSLAISESQFRNFDAENLEHRPWQHSHDESLRFEDSFPELRDRALRQAVTLIERSWQYLWQGAGTAEELAALIGNNSYLSGLPVNDPRNRRVSSLLPSGGGTEKGGR